MAEEWIKISDIETEAGTQVRLFLSNETVDEYSELYDRDDKDEDYWPFKEPIEVVRDSDGKNYPWDGFHRFYSAIKANQRLVRCNVEEGTLEDAKRKALGANADHGLRRTRADKQNAVEIALGIQTFAGQSDRKLADICSVSHTFVSKIRRQVEEAARKAKEKEDEEESENQNDDDQPGDEEKSDEPKIPKNTKIRVGEELPEEKKKEALEDLQATALKNVGELRRVVLDMTKVHMGAEAVLPEDVFDEDQDEFTKKLDEVLEMIKKISGLSDG